MYKRNKHNKIRFNACQTYKHLFREWVGLMAISFFWEAPAGNHCSCINEKKYTIQGDEYSYLIPCRHISTIILPKTFVREAQSHTLKFAIFAIPFGVRIILRGNSLLLGLSSLSKIKCFTWHWYWISPESMIGCIVNQH